MLITQGHKEDLRAHSDSVPAGAALTQLTVGKEKSYAHGQQAGYNYGHTGQAGDKQFPYIKQRTAILVIQTNALSSKALLPFGLINGAPSQQVALAKGTRM